METFDVTLGVWDRHLNDDLVKWVNAPSLEAVRKFIERYGLGDIIGQPPYPIGRLVDLVDGVDTVVNDAGEIISGQRNVYRRWRDELDESAH